LAAYNPTGSPSISYEDAKAALVADLNAAATPPPPEGIAARDAVIEEQVQAVVAAVRPYTVATLFIEELSDLVRAAIRSPASSKDGNHA
jgi:hypothetical protein